MHTSDFSIAFLEALTDDMRELCEDQTTPVTRSLAAANVVTFVSALVTLVLFRW